MRSYNISGTTGVLTLIPQENKIVPRTKRTHEPAVPDKYYGSPIKPSKNKLQRQRSIQRY